MDLVRARTGASLLVVRIVRGIADLIARPPPHKTECAFLRHRLPFLLFRTSRDAATQGREGTHDDTGGAATAPHRVAPPVWHGVALTGMMWVSIALRREQKKTVWRWGPQCYPARRRSEDPRSLLTRLGTARLRERAQRALSR